MNACHGESSNAVPAHCPFECFTIVKNRMAFSAAATSQASPRPLPVFRSDRWRFAARRTYFPAGIFPDAADLAHAVTWSALATGPHLELSQRVLLRSLRNLHPDPVGRRHPEPPPDRTLLLRNVRQRRSSSAGLDHLAEPH